MTWAMFSKPWQPLTPKGAAAFASASLTRLYVVLLCFATATGFAVVFFLSQMCVPVVDQLTRELPEGVVLSLGELFGLDESVSASTPFLSIDIDADAQLPDTHPSDVRVLFHKSGWKACSLLGCVEQAYLRDTTLALGPSHLGPKWAAWKPLVLGGAALGTVVWLFVVWTVLATVYCLPLWLAARATGRRLSLAGSWKISAAGLMPGSAMMVLAVVLYSLRVLDLPALAFVNAAHLVAGWIFLGVVVATLERREAKTGTKAAGNPFGGAPAAKPAGRTKKANPFGDA
jgi:hypothetical protein